MAVVAGKLFLALGVAFLLLAVLALATKYSGWPVETERLPLIGEVPGVTGLSRGALIVSLGVFSGAAALIGIGALLLRLLAIVDARARGPQTPGS
jgi:hypothetical protein